MRHLCLVLLLATGAPAVQAITSIADYSCSEWSARRASGRDVHPPQMWLSGFMTALATALRVDVLAITDAEAVFAWMDDYCNEYPDAQLSEGGQRLFNELLGRLPRSRPYLSRR